MRVSYTATFLVGSVLSISARVAFDQSVTLALSADSAVLSGDEVRELGEAYEAARTWVNEQTPGRWPWAPQDAGLWCERVEIKEEAP